MVMQEIYLDYFLREDKTLVSILPLSSAEDPVLS